MAERTGLWQLGALRILFGAICCVLFVVAVWASVAMLRTSSARTMAAEWIDELDSEDASTRFAAHDELSKHMASAAPLLQERMPSMGARAQALAIAALIRSGCLSEAETALYRYTRTHRKLPSKETALPNGSIAAITVAMHVQHWSVNVETIRPWLDCGDADLRKMALTMIAEADDAQSFDAALSAMHDTEVEVRARGISSASQMAEGVPQRRRRLLDALSSRYSVTRGQLDEPELSELAAALVPMVESDDIRVNQVLTDILRRDDLSENTRAIAALGILIDAGVPIDEFIRLSESDRVARALSALR